MEAVADHFTLGLKQSIKRNLIRLARQRQTHFVEKQLKNITISKLAVFQ